MSALQDAGLLDSVIGHRDEVFHSEIKEPDFEILKSFDEVTSLPVATTNVNLEYNVSRSQLPALSIFETTSSSSSRDERSTSVQERQECQPNNRITEKIPVSSNEQPAQVPTRNEQVMAKETSQVAAQSAANHLPALSIFDSRSSTSHSSKEEKQPSGVWKAETASRYGKTPQPIKSSHVVEQRETSPLKEQRKPTSPRPTARVITGRGPPRDSLPSGQTTISSIEPIELQQERRRILDFEDLYTARKEGEMVGIGARNKVSTFASPAFDPNARQKIDAARENTQGRQRPGLVLVTAEANGNTAYKPTTSSSTNEKGTSHGTPSRGPNANQTEKPVASPSINARPVDRRVMPLTANERSASNSKPVSIPGKNHEPIYEAVICKRADREEPQPEAPKEFYQKRDRARKITPPYHVLEEFARTYPRPNPRDQADGSSSSSTFQRDSNTLDPNDTIGRSLSEPANTHNGRPISPWDRQSSSNSQRSLEVEQEYRSLVEGKYLQYTYFCSIQINMNSLKSHRAIIILKRCAKSKIFGP